MCVGFLCAVIRLLCSLARCGGKWVINEINSGFFFQLFLLAVLSIYLSILKKLYCHVPM